MEAITVAVSGDWSAGDTVYVAFRYAQAAAGLLISEKSPDLDCTYNQVRAPAGDFRNLTFNSKVGF